ncbi:MAG: UMP kinase [Candidatus Altiarchaeota archaeon]
MKIVFSIGGSVLVPDEIDDAFLAKITGFLRTLSEKHTLYVVAGGGKIARKYQQTARASGADDELLDWLGIYTTRLNALLLASAVGKRANRRIPQTIEEALSLSRTHPILVMGGTDPKHSTDAVAAELAYSAGAELFINASNIDGVYDKDPKKNSDAKLIERMSAKELLALVEKIPQSPGDYALIDRMAVESVMRSKVKTIVLNGRDLDNIRKAVLGEEFKGTTILG